MLSVLLSLAVQATQAPPAQRPALTVSVRPANPTVVVGDSIRLTGEVRDSTGRAVPEARVRWLGGSFEGGVDSTGLVRAGAVGTFVAYAVPTVDGKPSRPTPISVRILAQPASRIALNHRASKLVVGQRLPLDADVFAANGDRRRDAVTWASSAPTIAVVSGTGRVTAARRVRPRSARRQEARAANAGRGRREHDPTGGNHRRRSRGTHG